MDDVLKEVLKKVTPTGVERDEMRLLLNNVLSATDKVIKPLKLGRTVAGSFIRDTWLSDKREIDLFIMFPVSYSRNRLEKTGLELGKKIMKVLKGEYEIAYAEHPYVKGFLGNYTVDIVPCYKVKTASKIKSAVDRTPFHNRYIEKNLKPEMSGEVRLLKKFLKLRDVYGSDIKTLGFSGYLCELLIIKYKNFKSLVLNAQKWEPGDVFIDLGNHCSIKNPKIYFKNQPLIVIDPTDPKRNVAAIISPENFVKFTLACKEFVKKPSRTFFFGHVVKVGKEKFIRILKGRGTELVLIKFRRPDVVDDVLWSQLRRTGKRVKDILEDYEFKVLGYDVWSDENWSCLLFEMEVWELPNVRRVLGPPIFSKKHSQEFIKKYKKSGRIFVDGICWVAETPREFTVVKMKLKDSLKKPVRILKAKGIRSYIALSISKGFKILGNKEILNLVGKDHGFAIFFNDYLEKKLI